MEGATQLPRAVGNGEMTAEQLPEPLANGEPRDAIARLLRRASPRGGGMTAHVVGSFS